MNSCPLSKTMVWVLYHVSPDSQVSIYFSKGDRLDGSPEGLKFRMHTSSLFLLYYPAIFAIS
jgi:hypothetical protein